MTGGSTRETYSSYTTTLKLSLLSLNYASGIKEAHNAFAAFSVDEFRFTPAGQDAVARIPKHERNSILK
jgi:hypothetical protein